ncbi:DNA mismatch repair protein MutT [Heyndrickxia camelliae]|uniref:DNA mismatch repair protein MutT n=2 Tax=Heyndrickxia camelliae TaxID=1707093 RepID=A0A2N3LLP5_9BACI|nr:NUDIX domain-containing protein [Heyndrickxia camelliae]PKR85474.1 DNA mismatch repair protein MutT [Heyndrickxia camelliae]
MMVENQMIVGVKGVIIKNGRVLIIKRCNEAHVAGGTWEGVGGKIEFGEDLESALKREVMEEVGLEIQIKQILYATTFQTSPTRQVVIITYLCTCDNKDITLSNEHSDYLWATYDELKTYLPKGILADFERNNVFSLLFA